LIADDCSRGKNTIKVAGTLLSNVNLGTKIEIRAKVDFMTVYHETMDLCDLAKSKMGISCPIKAGPFKVEKEFEIPARIPHVREPFYPILGRALTETTQAKINVALTGKTKEGKQLTCYNIQAVV
jgi:hypothetical protein